MRLPSLRVLAAAAGRTFSAYPLVIIAAALAAAFAIANVEAGNEPVLTRLLMSAQMGIPLFFAVAMFGRRIATAQRRILEAICLALLATYFFTTASGMSPTTVTRFVQFNVGLHLLVAFLPFVAAAGVNGFWQYNRTLFLRFLLALLYSFVLFAGLAIALAALDELLGLPVSEEAYVRLWIVIAFVFNTWFFVGGISPNPDDFAEVSDYPRGLKVFTQYVLVPLVIVYLVILTIYLGKVLVTRSWPSGWIGYLVSSVAAVGILAMLLVHPIKDAEGNAWVRTFSRWFYVFLIPSIGMLATAVLKRIDQYGITEKRYFLLVLTAWLAATALYFIASRAKNIKWIPVTLCLVAFATSYGPWGAFAVSERSQVNRLRALLSDNGRLHEERVVTSGPDVSTDDRREMSAILHYLAVNHDFDGIRDWFDPPLPAADSLGFAEEGLHESKGISRAQTVMKRLDLEWEDHRAPSQREYFHLMVANEPRVRSVQQYDYYARLDWRAPAESAVAVADSEYVLSYEPDTRNIVLRRQDSTVVAAPLDAMLERARTEGWAARREALQPEYLWVEAVNGGYRLEVQFNNLSGRWLENGFEVTYFGAVCLIGLP